MKLRLPKTRRYRVYLYILSIFLILLAIDLVLVRIGRHITIGYDTTRITTPLKADGTPDYIAAIEAQYSAGVTPENNAAPLFFQTFGPDYIASNIAHEPIYARLGMQPLPQDGPYYVSFVEYLKKVHPGQKWDTQETTNRLLASRAHPWKSADDPELAAWLDFVAVPLATLHEGTLRSRYFMPPMARAGAEDQLLISILLPSLAKIRDAAYALSARVMLNAGRRDFDKIRDDLLTVHRLAWLQGQDFTLIGSLVAISIEESACEMEQALVSSGLFTSGELRRLLLDLDGVAPFPEISQRIDAERYCVLDTLVYCSRHPDQARRFLGESGDSDDARLLSRMLGPVFYPSNFNGALRLANHYYNRYVTAASAPTFADSNHQAHALEKEIGDRVLATSALDTAQVLFVGMAPSLARYLELHRNMLVNRDLTRLALALALFHAEHDAYPDSLAALAPAYLPVIPEDRFTSAPLHYLKTPTGFLLYSVGPNMTDDAGHNYHMERKFNNADDIAVLVGPYPEALPATTSSRPAALR